MKQGLLFIWLFGAVAALAQVGDSILIPVEVYDSTTFADWPGHPPMNGFVEVDQEPMPLNFTEILAEIGYPSLYREAGISPTSVFRILVDTDGSIMRIVGIRGFEPWLPELGAYFRKLEFAPAMKDREPVRCWVNILLRICPARN